MTLIKFFHNQATHPSGALLKDILAWDDYQWEVQHDFIQWVFPTQQISAFNQNVPPLTSEDVEYFRKNNGIQQNLNKVYERFLAFLALDKNFTEIPWWYNQANHNLLRITRALDSLKTLSIQGQETKFLGILHKLIEAHPGQIPDHTILFWENAAREIII